MYFNWKREKSKKKKRNDSRQQIIGSPLTHATLRGRAYRGASSDTMKGHFLTNSGATHVIERTRMPLMNERMNNTVQ
jgi:hypothetical protein